MSLVSQEIRDRIAERQAFVARRRIENLANQFQYIRPPEAAALDLIDAYGNPGYRLSFGIARIDQAMRGVGRGELCYMTGRSHAGKTWVLMNLIRHNPASHLILYSPDESRNSVLSKLVGITYDIPSREVQERLERGDARVRQLVERTTTIDFPHLLINHDSLTFRQMSECLREAEQYWQTPCDGVMVDYLDLLPGPTDYNGTRTKSVGLKRWAKTEDVPTIGLHQPKRGGAARGQRIGMDDMSQGGETEAMFVLGVYRERDDRGAETWHENTITLLLDKNKRTGEEIEVVMHLDPRTGAIRGLREEDKVIPGEPVPSARAAVVARAQSKVRHPSTDKVIELALRRHR